MDKEKAFRITKGKTIAIISIFVVIFGLIIAFVIIKRQQNKVYKKYSVESTYEVDSSISRSYKKYKDGILAYSKDGISYIKSGKEIWNKAISMNEPIIDTCKDYIVLADHKTNQVNIFDNLGNQYNITMTYPIIKVKVSSQGVVAATLDDGTANYIELRDKNGEQLALGRTVISGDGYPVDFSLSDDGTKLVSSYLAMTGGSTQSKVVFYNYSAVGQNQVDRIVGGFNQYTTTIVPEVDFMGNNSAVAFGDNMFTIYSAKQTPKIVKEESFEDKITSVFYSSKYIGIVFQSSDTENPYYVKVYDKSGEKILKKSIDFQYTDISFVGENIVLYGTTQCKMISLSGKVRFNYIFDHNITKLIPISDHEYVIAFDDKIQQIMLR